MKSLIILDKVTQIVSTGCNAPVSIMAAVTTSLLTFTIIQILLVVKDNLKLARILWV